jgi:hypothetical protein
MVKKVPLAIFLATFFAVLSILIQPGTPVHAESPESQCWAVIVGVADYQSLDDLHYSDDGARELSQQLSPIWGGDHIKLLLDSKASKTDVRAAIDWLVGKAAANDTVVFYFSGHSDPEGYIAPYDAYYVETWISSRELGDWLARLNSKRVVIILSTCNAGQYEASVGGSGRVVLLASRSDEKATEYGSLTNEVFSYYLLEGLGAFDGTDANHDYELSAEELYGYAGPKTASFATANGRLQHPVLSDGYPGELALLAKFSFSTKPGLPAGSEIVVVDGKAYSSVPPPVIWAPGSTHNLKVPPLVDKGGGTRYVFASWQDGDASVSRAITRGAYTANYNVEYLLRINSAYSEPSGAGWYSSGSSAAISVQSIEEPTIKHIFTGWSGDYSGDTPTASVIMNSPKTVTANWRTDYLLTITSPYGEPEGAGWYNEGSTATISVAPTVGTIIRHVFTGWSGDFTEDTATASLTVNSPNTITANWRTDYTQLYILISAIVLLVVTITLILRIRQRKAKAGLGVGGGIVMLVIILVGVLEGMPGGKSVTESIPPPPPTVVSSPTPSPSPLSPAQTPIPTPTPSPSSQKLLFEDDFSDPTSGWPVWSEATSEFKYENGEYSVLIKTKTAARSLLQYAKGPLSDFSVEVDVKDVSTVANSYAGVVFREAGGNRYIFSVRNTDGAYEIRKVLSGQGATVLRDWTKSSYIKTGAETNRLKVVCRGAEIEVYANGQKLDTITDTSLTSGDVGLIVTTYEQPNANYHFDNFKLYEVTD